MPRLACPGHVDHQDRVAPRVTDEQAAGRLCEDEHGRKRGRARPIALSRRKDSQSIDRVGGRVELDQRKVLPVPALGRPGGSGSVPRRIGLVHDSPQAGEERGCMPCGTGSGRAERDRRPDAACRRVHPHDGRIHRPDHDGVAVSACGVLDATQGARALPITTREAEVASVRVEEPHLRRSSVHHCQSPVVQPHGGLDVVQAVAGGLRVPVDPEGGRDIDGPDRRGVGPGAGRLAGAEQKEHERGDTRTNHCSLQAGEAKRVYPGYRPVGLNRQRAMRPSPAGRLRPWHRRGTCRSGQAGSRSPTSRSRDSGLKTRRRRRNGCSRRCCRWTRTGTRGRR